MTRREVAFYTGALILFGAGWGLSQPLAKIAVSTGYEPLGLIFWQLVIWHGPIGSKPFCQFNLIFQSSGLMAQNFSASSLVTSCR